MDIKTIGVEDWLNVWEKSATYDIAQSTIASMTMGEILQLDGQAGATFYDRLNQEKMNYGWIEGSPEFKAEVAKLYRTEIDPDCILQTNGTTGANLMALMQLVEPGDHVIAEYPTYQPLYEIPRTLGAEVEYWHLREENGWNPSIDELKELVRPDTKLICINNASNPLGAVLDRETLEQIVEIAQSVGAYVLSDGRLVRSRCRDQFHLEDLLRARCPHRLDGVEPRAGRQVPRVPRLHDDLLRRVQRRAGHLHSAESRGRARAQPRDRVP